jgi:hypothetical protein
MMRHAPSFILCLTLAGCGGSTADEIIGLSSNSFLANQPFVLTVLVADPVACAEVRLDEATCEVDVNEDERTIRVKAEVPFEETDGCVPDGGLRGGLPVACSVDALPAGTYTVRSRGDQPFSTPIELF